MVKPISPYLLRPLRSLEEAMRDLEADAEREHQAKPPPAAPAEGTAKAGNPKDTVTIAGQDVAIPPAEPTVPVTGGQVDVKA